MLAAACGGRATKREDAQPTEPADVSQEPVACVTGPGTTVLARSPVVLQPAVADGDVIVVLDGDIVRITLASGDAEGVGATRSSSAPVVLGDQVYFEAGSQTFSVATSGNAMAHGVPELVSLRPLMQDGSALYLDDYGSKLERWDPASGTVSKLELGSKLSVNATAVYGDYVYIAGTEPTDGFTNGAIARIPKLGGALQMLVTNLGHPWSLVANEAGLYWSEDPPGLFDAGPGRVAHSKLDGSDVTTILPTVATSLAFAAGRIYASYGAEITSVTSAGDDLTLIASGLENPGMLAVAGGNLIFVDPISKALSSTEPQVVMTTCATR